ncbi:hypothetical protein Tco_0488181 [Tanacetum coccineum]
MVAEVPQTLEYKGGQLNAALLLEDFQDSLNNEEDTRSSQEYLNDLEEEYQARALLAKSKGLQKGILKYQQELRPTKDFKAKYNKVKAKLALLTSSASASKALMVKNKVLMELAKDNDAVSKEGAKNGELGKDLYEKEQRNNLLSKHRNLVQELNTFKEQLLVLKQAKLDFLTMQHVNTEILKENQNLRKELKELTTITETWLNSSNKVN